MEYLQYSYFTKRSCKFFYRVLNLVISRIPSILYLAVKEDKAILVVLNLVISGIPSIFKGGMFYMIKNIVLNLVINGIPSIQKK